MLLITAAKNANSYRPTLTSLQ